MASRLFQNCLSCAYPTIKVLGLLRYFSNASLPISRRPVSTSIIGQGVLAKAIARNTSALPHMIDMPETCNPSPPTACGVPSSLASFLRLHSGSCSASPLDTPNKLICIPCDFGIRQVSFPPAPITVGAIAEGTGFDNGPCLLFVMLVLFVVLLLSTVLPSPTAVFKSPVTSCAGNDDVVNRSIIAQCRHIRPPSAHAPLDQHT